MRVAIVLDENLNVIQVEHAKRYLSIQNHKQLCIMDHELFLRVASFLNQRKRVNNWSDGEVDNRVLMTFDNLLDIKIPLYTKDDVSSEYDIHRGDESNNFNILYLDLGTLLDILTIEQFKKYDKEKFQSFISEKGIDPKVNLRDVNIQGLDKITKFVEENS